MFDPSAPFGLLDPDVKAYFRQVEERITEWENVPVQLGEDGEEEREGEPLVYALLSQLTSKIAVTSWLLCCQS